MLNLDGDTATVATTDTQAPGTQTPANGPDTAGDAVDQLRIDGVVGGSSPRIMVNGLLVHIGGIADYRHQLRFTAVDTVKHIVFFKDGADGVFPKHY